MMKQLLAGLVGALLLVAWLPWSAEAGCVVEVSGSYTDGKALRDIKCDTSGNQKVSGAVTNAGTFSVQVSGHSFSNITLAAPTTTVVKSGAGVLHTITVNKTTALGVIQCFDNTAASGTVIATITQPAAVLATSISLIYDVAFATGLTCLTSTAAQDLTVSYR